MLKIISQAAAGGALLFVLLPGAPVRAAEPAEDALTNWVASIDATDFWSAHYQAIAYDPASRTATLSGLAVEAKNGLASIGFEAIALTGYAAAGDGSFTAETIKADGGTIKAGFVSVAVSDLELHDVAVPVLASVAVDKEHPFTSLIRGYAQLAKTKLGRGSVAEVAIIEQIEDVTSRISYENIQVNSVVDGKIASVTGGPLKLESPSPDGLVDMTVSSVESRDLDFGALIRVYDPDQYVGGVGDEVWHTVLGRSAYHDMTIAAPGAKITIAGTSVEDLKVRQPKVSFAGLFDKVMAHPEEEQDDMDTEGLRQLVAMLSAFGVGRLSVDGVNVEATGIDRMKLGGFHIADLSIDGLGELAFDGIDGAVGGQGAVKVGHFAFGGIKFPGEDALVGAIEADKNGETPDVMALIPTLGFVEAAAVDVSTADLPSTKLDRARLDLGNYVGIVPTSISSEVVGIDFPAALIKDADARAVFDKLGYDRVHADYGLKVNWHEADQSVTIDELSAGLKDVGSLAISATLVGLTRDAIEHVETMGDALPGLSFTGGKLVFKDASIVGRGLNLLAEKLKSPPDKFRQQFADALPLLLSLAAAGDPEVGKALKESGLLPKLTPVIKSFVAAPGSFIITAAPASPIPVMAVAAALHDAPETVPSLLNLNFASEPAQK